MGVTCTTADYWQVDDLACESVVRVLEEVVRDGFGKMVTKDHTYTADGESVTVKVPKKVYIRQKRDHYTLSISRKLVGVVGFREQAGQTCSRFDLATGPSSRMAWWTTNKKWVCTNDRLKKSESTVGEYVQEQVWQYYGEWVDFAAGAFE